MLLFRNFVDRVKSFIDFFIFSSLFIATICLAAVYQTYTLLQLPLDTFYWFGPFAFFSTLCSYNFHWWLTPNHQMEAVRSRWTQRHRIFQVQFSGLGLAVALFCSWNAQEHWLKLTPALVLTFFYTAPKIPWKPFELLRKLAVGKTMYLASVWTYVTVLLPILISNQSPSMSIGFYVAGKFFFLLALCMLFDWRDQKQDQLQSIRSLATLLNPKQLRFYLQLSLYVSLSFSLSYLSFDDAVVNSLAPVATLLLVPLAWKSNSDYLYYGLLDGLIGVSGILYFCQKML